MSKKSTTEQSETPLMKQYNQIKAKHPEALLLFRVGDFYETFGEDAVKASKTLGIVLTKRKNGAASHIELAGFPHHSLENYLPKLVRAGFRVAVCDQLEDPKATKTIVKRGVTELVTPGVAFNDQVLDSKKNNFLCAIHFDKEEHGVAFLDVSTGEFFVAQGNISYIDKLVQGFEPSEIIYQKKFKQTFIESFSTSYHSYRMEDWAFQIDFALESITKHFKVNSLKGFGIQDLNHATIAAGAIFQYLNETEHKKLGHIVSISRIDESNYVWLDRFTVRNLELVHSLNENATTLLDILDQTSTPMGSRLLKRWLLLPLKDVKLINKRLNIVEAFYQNADLFSSLHSEFEKLGDLERLISKIAIGRISPKELKQLEYFLIHIKPIKSQLQASENKEVTHLANDLDVCKELIDKIHQTIEEEPANQIGKGNIIKIGFNSDLDELRNLSNSGKNYLDDLQNRESNRTGIPSLKVSFNNVFGYYLEVTNAHKDKVPTEWIRKQTLVNAERYITEELKEYEHKILGAEDKIQVIESQLYTQFISEIQQYTLIVQKNAKILAEIDCLLNFSKIAKENNYVKPVVDASFDISIKNGRHPVIEKQLNSKEIYIANDIELNKEEQQIIMITGPNMSGKSAILRQTALICLMAQIGSFVPADSAKLGYLDKIFTRVGASDNISSGESTFMVEMNETSSILNNLSDRSLILLDEIGRGTSTFDGISIAWSIAAYIHEHHKHKSKTLFATHYHELNEMTLHYNRIKNYNVAVKETGEKVLFLRKLIPGGSHHSFGIYVAQLAGMPQQVIKKAQKLLTNLEKQKLAFENNSKTKKIKEEKMQLSFFQLNDPVLENIREELVTIDINTLTPVEALIKLNEIKKMVGG